MQRTVVKLQVCNWSHVASDAKRLVIQTGKQRAGDLALLRRSANDDARPFATLAAVTGRPGRRHLSCVS